MKKISGFTLVELLVVIAIIAILATIGVTNLSTARAKARDAQRLSDIKAIDLALQLYFQANGRYPINCSGACTCDPDPTEAQKCGGLEESHEDIGDPNDSFLSSLVASGYLSEVPLDPVNSQSDNMYYMYMYYNPAANSGWGCGTNHFYLLGIKDLESTNGIHPTSPFNNERFCASKDFYADLGFEWLTGDIAEF